MVRLVKDFTRKSETDSPVTTLSNGGGESAPIQDNVNVKERRWSLDKVLFYALVFFTPIFFLPTTLFPVNSNKQLFVGAVLFVALLYVVAKFLSGGKVVVPKTWALYSVSVLFLAVLTSAIFSQARDVSFLGQSPDSLFWVSAYILAFLLGLVILKDKQAILTSAFAYVASMGLLVLFAFLQFSGVTFLPFDFAKSLSFNPVGTSFSVAFVIAAAFCGLLSFLITHKVFDKRLRVTLWVLVGLFALFILQVNLWSMWLTLALTFVVISLIVAYSTMQTKQVSMRPLLVPFLVIIIALSGIFLSLNIPSFVKFPAEVSPTFNATVDITKNSLGGVRALWGTGPGTFSYNYSLYRPVNINNTQFWGIQFNQGYSSFVSNVSTWGILGALALLAVLFAFYKTILLGIMKSAKDRKDSMLHSVAIGAFAVSLFFGISLFVYKGNSVSYMLLFLSATVGMTALYELGVLKSIKLELFGSLQKMLIASLAAIVLGSVALGSFYFLGQQYLGQVYTAQAVKVYQKDKNLNKALEKLDKALKTNKNDDDIARVSSQALMLRLGEVANDTSVTAANRNSQASALFENAAKAASMAVNINSKELQNWLQVGQVYAQITGLVDKAEDVAISAYDKAQELDPFNPSLPLAQARVYVGLSDILQGRIASATAIEQQELASRRLNALNGAVEKLEEAIELKDDYATARFLLASAYKKLGNLDAAIVQIQKIAKDNPKDANIALQLGLFYYQSENFSLARGEFERALDIANNVFGNARYFLALTYDKLGDSGTAIQHMEKVLQDNQDSELVKTILVNLRAGRPALTGLEDVTPPETGGAQGPTLP